MSRLVFRKLLTAGFCAALCLADGSVSVSGYEPRYSAIFRVNIDGSGMETVLPSNVAKGRGAFAVNQEYMFWVGGISDDIPFIPWLRRSNLDGSGQQNFWIGPIGGIAIDSGNAKLYLSPQSDCAPGCSAIVRTDLDAENRENLFPTGHPGSIAFYDAGGLVCWFDLVFGDGDPDFGEGIACGTLGEPEGQLVVEEDWAEQVGLAIDPIGQKLYWTRPDRIRRSNLDGSNIEDVVTGLDDATGLTLDPAGSRMWWTERDPGKVRGADMDGANVHDLVTGLDQPVAIGFLRLPGGEEKVYWLSEAPPVSVPATSALGLVFMVLIVLAGSAWLLVRARRITRPAS